MPKTSKGMKGRAGNSPQSMHGQLRSVEGKQMKSKIGLGSNTTSGRALLAKNAQGGAFL